MLASNFVRKNVYTFGRYFADKIGSENIDCKTLYKHLADKNFRTMFEKKTYRNGKSAY